MSVRTLSLSLIAAAGLAAVVCATYQARYLCLSHEPGLRGEVMRRSDGTYLYFNGECWTTRFVAPTDMPF